MTDFEAAYPKLFGVCHVASQVAERHPITSKVVIDGLAHMMEAEGISQERADEILIEAGAAVLIHEAVEICND